MVKSALCPESVTGPPNEKVEYLCWMNPRPLHPSLQWKLLIQGVVRLRLRKGLNVVSGLLHVPVEIEMNGLWTHRYLPWKSTSGPVCFSVEC